MKNFLGQIVNTVKEATKKTTQAVNDALDHEDTQIAIEWAKKTAGTAADETVRLGKEIARSDMTKDAAAGAAIGAAVALPLPIIGPAAGAVIGAGLGIYKNITKPAIKTIQSTLPENQEKTPQKNDAYEQLIKFDELKQKGIITEEEFAEQKRKIFKQIS
jgi:hypothetical protein